VVEVTFTKRAAKSLRRLPANDAARICAAVDRLAAQPHGGHHDVKTLHGVSGLKRLRVGTWRILFEMPSTDELLVLDVLPRGRAYRRIGGDD
jgi:mRNA interferase RelE/StbE